MAKRWSGDGTYVLPAGQVEPYRLWFEYLKLATCDPNIKIKTNRYGRWGQFEKLTFDQWWTDHWRELFAVRHTQPVNILQAGQQHTQTNGRIIVEIDIAASKADILSHLQKILQQTRPKKSSKRSVSKAEFPLSLGSEIGFEKRLNVARCMLRLYGYWLENPEADARKRIERAAIKYRDWATTWDQKIKAKGYKRPRPYLPACFHIYCEFLEQKRNRRQEAVRQRLVGSFQKDGSGTNAEDARRMVVRYIRKARKIAENVAQGQFPGRY